MATRQYIGARYVPKIMGNWSATVEYEPLSIVLSLDGNSYTSKTYVPKGTALTNETYWSLTGNYNAQVEAYRQEVIDLIDMQPPVGYDNLTYLAGIQPFAVEQGKLTNPNVENHQGMAIGNNVCVTAFIKSDETVGILIARDMTTGEKITSIESADLGHANSITYCDKDSNFYIITMRGKVLVYNSSLNYVKQFNVNGFAISYCKEKEVFHVLNAGQLIEYDYDFNLLRSSNMRALPTGYIAQGMFEDENFIYFINQTTSAESQTLNYVDVYDIEHLLYYRTIQVQFTQELEDGSYYDGKFYLSANLSSRAYLFRASLVNTDLPTMESIWAANITSTKINAITLDFYVDETYDGFFSDGTLEHPFVDTYQTGEIEFVTDNIWKLRYFLLSDISHNINIRGAKTDIYIEGIDAMREVQGINLESLHQGEIKNVKITSRSDASNALLNATNVDTVLLTSVTFEGDGTEANAINLLGVSGLYTTGCVFNSDTTSWIINTNGDSTCIDMGSVTYGNNLTQAAHINKTTYLGSCSNAKLFSNMRNPLNAIMKAGSYNILDFVQTGTYRFENHSELVGAPTGYDNTNMVLTVLSRSDDMALPDVIYFLSKINEVASGFIGKRKGNYVFWYHCGDESVSTTGVDANILSTTVRAQSDIGRHILIDGHFKTGVNRAADDLLLTFDNMWSPIASFNQWLTAVDRSGNSYILRVNDGKIYAGVAIPANAELYINGTVTALNQAYTYTP